MDNAYLDAAETLCRQAGIPCPVAEFKFHPKRKWRFDLCWPAAHVALEVEGGVYSRGRHVRASGFLGDLEKYNAATVMGWRVLRVTPQQLNDGGWTRDVAYLIGMTED